MNAGTGRRDVMATAKTVAGTAVAAAALAAVTAFSGPAIMPSDVSSAASSRIAGVHDDLVRAVSLNQVTQEQAVLFEQKIIRRIQSGA